MRNLRLISRFIGLSSLLPTALVVLRSREIAPPGFWVDALGSQNPLKSHQSDNERGEDSPTWPPPEGMYWGM